MQNPAQGEVDVIDGHGFSQAEDEGAGKLSTGRLVLAASKDNIVIIEADVEIFDTTAGGRARRVGTQELEGHGW